MIPAVILLALAACGDEAARVAAQKQLAAQVGAMEQRVATLEAELARRERAAADAAPGPAVTTAAAVVAKPSDAVLRISLGQGGARIEGIPVAADAFDAKLEEHGRTGVRSVLLQVDPDLPQSEVTAVLDRIKRSGIGGGNVALVRGNPAPVDLDAPDTEG